MMKRFLFPCCLAVAMHALLLFLGAGWIEKRSFPRWTPAGDMALILLTQQVVSETKKQAPFIQSPKKIDEFKKEKVKQCHVQKRPVRKAPLHVKKPELNTKQQKKRLSDKNPLPFVTTHNPEKTTDLQDLRQAKEISAPGYNNRQLAETGPDSAPAGPGGRVTRYARPEYSKNPRPVYPKLARKRGYEGVVLLEVLVNKAGVVEDLRVKKTSGHAILDRAAEKSVKKWMFEPAMIGGKAIQTWVVVPVRFKLE